MLVHNTARSGMPQRQTGLEYVRTQRRTLGPNTCRFGPDHDLPGSAFDACDPGSDRLDCRWDRSGPTGVTRNPERPRDERPRDADRKQPVRFGGKPGQRDRQHCTWRISDCQHLRQSWQPGARDSVHNQQRQQQQRAARLRTSRPIGPGNDAFHGLFHLAGDAQLCRRGSQRLRRLTTGRLGRYVSEWKGAEHPACHAALVLGNPQRLSTR